MTTKEEKNDLMKVFKILDKNGDGKLTREELEEGYKKSVPIDAIEINELMKKLDNDGSGSIDYTGSEHLTKNSLLLLWTKKKS